MPSKPSIGKISCPCCGAVADVRLSASNFAFIFCDTDCNLQVFTRNRYQHEKLMARMKPNEAAQAESAPTEAAQVKQKPTIGLLIS